MAKLLLGIDGGGTRTRAWLADGTGRILHRGEAGPANRHLIGLEGVTATFNELFPQLWTLHDNRDLAAVACGLAGLTGAEEELTRVLRGFLPPETPLHLTTDAHIALTGAHAGAPGIILVAGTGSICLARTGDGRIHRAGGRGTLFDDAGSARWIGHRALQTAARQADGRLPGRAVLHAALEHFDAPDIDALAPAAQAVPEHIPWLAPAITALAEAGVADARAIIEDAVRELTALVEAIRRHPGVSDLSLATVGGLLEGSPYARDRLTARLAERVHDTRIQPATLTPVAGAVIEAYHLTGKEELTTDNYGCKNTE